MSPERGVSVYGKILDQKVLNKFNLSGIKSNFSKQYGLSLNVIDKFKKIAINQFNRCVIFNSQHYQYKDFLEIAYIGFVSPIAIGVMNNSE